MWVPHSHLTHQTTIGNFVQRLEHFLLANKIVNNEEKCFGLIGASKFKLTANLATPKQPGKLKFKGIVNTLK